MSQPAPSRTVRRAWIPIALALLLGTFIAWGYHSEHFMRVAFLYLGAILWVLLTGLWWVFLSGGGFRWRSLLGGLAAGALLIGIGSQTLRYEGSASGAAPLKLAWKWSPTAETGLGEAVIPGSSPVEPAPAPAALPGLAAFPGFLGPDRNGRVPDPGLATNWETHPPEEIWRIRVGPGWSSFAVTGDRAVTQEQRSQTELVTCYDLTTGALLWAHEDDVRFDEAMGGPGPRATPTIRDGVVHAIGATGILNALDLATGSLRWSVNVLELHNAHNGEWGVAASPLVLDDLIVVSAGEGAESADSDTVISAFAREDGTLRWSYGPGRASYSSPCLIEINGEPQVVAVLAEAVVGLDPATGAERWKFNWPGSFPKVAQPVQTAPDQLLVTSSYGLESHLLRIDGSTAEPVWSARQMKTKFSSSVVKDGYAYGLDEGKLICMEIATGKRLWKGGRYGYGQNLLVGDDLLLIQGERGEVILCRATPDGHDELASISPLSDMTWNAPALAGKYLLVRNDREAVCLKLP